MLCAENTNLQNIRILVSRKKMLENLAKIKAIIKSCKGVTIHHCSYNSNKLVCWLGIQLSIKR